MIARNIGYLFSMGAYERLYAPPVGSDWLATCIMYVHVSWYVHEINEIRYTWMSVAAAWT